MLHRGLYIQALLDAFVETSQRVFSHSILIILFWSFLVLVFSLLVLGEYFPKENSYKNEGYNVDNDVLSEDNEGYGVQNEN